MREDGSLDTSFSSGGTVAFGLGDYGSFTLDSQGGIVAAVAYEDGNMPPSAIQGLVRLTRDGALDPTFGDGGFVRTENLAGAVAVDPTTGKIAVIGVIPNPDGSFARAIKRLNSDGTVDETFGQDGLVQVPIVTFHHIDRNGRKVDLPHSR